MTQDSPRITTGRLLAYGAPAFSLAAMTLPAYVMLPTFYAEHLGLGLASVGIVLFMVRMWDVITDPVIGAVSDRLNGRFGRRRPVILVGAPLVMIGGWMLFRPPSDVDTTYLALWSVVLYLGWTMVILPLSAWGAELSDDYDERTRLAGAREGFVVVGILVVLSLAGIFGLDDEQASRQTLGAVAWLIILTLPVGLVLLLAFVPERQVTTRRPIAWREGFSVIAGNRPFRRLLIAYVVNGVSNGLPATLFLLFVAHVLQAEPQSGMLLFAYFAAGVVAVPGWIWLAGRWGKHRTWSIAMLATCAAFAFAPFLGPGDTLAFLAICIVTGIGLGADLTLPAAVQADVVDVDTAETGERRTGLYFALWGMATKLALAAAVGVALPILEASGFEASSGPSAGGGTTLVVLYAIVPIVLKLIAIALMWRFPLDRTAQAALRAKIGPVTKT